MILQGYLVLFNCWSEKQQLISLGRSLFPQNSKIIINAFEKLEKMKLSAHENYLIFDVCVNSKLEKPMKIFTNIFSEERYFFIINQH